jgi:hypothetical protein
VGEREEQKQTFLFTLKNDLNMTLKGLKHDFEMSLNDLKMT